MGSCGRCLLYLFYIVMIVIGLFFTIVGALFFTTALNTKGNCKVKEVISLAHRGDTETFQENTKEGDASAITKGYNAEFDINTISTGEIVVFHDDNALELTGTDLEITAATLSQIQNLKYKLTIRGTTYLTQPSVPLLKDSLNAMCTIDSEAALDFDIKFSPSTENMKALMDIIDNSKCSCSDKQVMIFATPYFYKGKTIRTAFEGRRCNKGKISIWFHPGSLPLGVYFWLKTRWVLNLGDADYVSTHYKVWDYYPELLKSYNEDGWCTAAYGNKAAILNNYNITGYRVVDVSQASYEEVEYTGDSASYKALIGTTVIGVIILAVFLLLMILTCCSCICKVS
jgi:glycerophosphoryl diester phosphodiesterase